MKRFLPVVAGVGAIFGLAGAFMLYRALSSNDVGEACGENDCNGIMGEYCIHDDLGSFCAPQCDSDADCPSQWSCIVGMEVDTTTGYEHESSVKFCMRPVPVFQPQSLRSGAGPIASLSGALPGVTPDSQCSWEQTTADPRTGFDTRWTVTCGQLVVYGGGDVGYNPSTDPSWPTGTLVSDPHTTHVDGDPSIVFSEGTLTVRDDAAGPHGAFQLVLTNQ